MTLLVAKLNPCITQGNRRKEDEFEFNKDAGMYICKAGHIKSNEHTEQAIFQDSEYFKEKSKERYKVEAKNSELKHRHGYDVASAAGLVGMEMQGAIAIFAVNLKRILKILGK